MVKIVGSEKEVKLILTMLDCTDADACTHQTTEMKENEFGVCGFYINYKLDFTVEYEFAELNSNISKTILVKECPHIKTFEEQGWDMDYCIHCEGYGEYKECRYKVKS